MREILFRGKRLDNGEWVEGNYILQNDSDPKRANYMVPHIKLRNCVNMYAVDPETVGQYTGLKDKNGKRIFEGDIIAVYSPLVEQKELNRFVVDYGVSGDEQNTKITSGYVGFHFLPANEKTKEQMEFGLRNDILFWLQQYDCTVIGNANDNPELLQKPQELEVL